MITQPQIPNKKLTFFTSIGAGLEYFDFITYGLLASYLSQLFFPSHDNVIGLLEIFAVFALGYFIRPLGGMLFGHFADRFGRKKTFLVSLTMMAIATFTIGCLPIYAEIGLLAPILLISCRLFQGLAFGAELPGAATFLIEHVNKSDRGLHIGLVLSGVSLGAMFGAALIYILNTFFTPVEMLSLGWRIPFWLGGGLAILSFWLRSRLTETPMFLQQAKQKVVSHPIYYAFRHHPRSILLGVMITLFSACFILFGVSMPAYLHHFYNYSMDTVYFYVTLGFIWSALILPAFGWLSDRIGRSKMLVVTTFILIIASYFLFGMLALRTEFALAIFILFYQAFIAALATCYMTTLPELFPTSVRFTGVAICYNLAFTLASLTPLILTAIAGEAGGPHLTFLFFSLLAISTFIAAFHINNHRVEELKQATF